MKPLHNRAGRERRLRQRYQCGRSKGGSPFEPRVLWNQRKSKGQGGKRCPRYNILVVRINAEGQLVNSQPCCLCINLHQIDGIYRIYYSNDNGEICYQKISDMDTEDTHISRGLTLMIGNWPDFIKVARLPLTKKQKTELLYGRGLCPTLDPFLLYWDLWSWLFRQVSKFGFDRCQQKVQFHCIHRLLKAKFPEFARMFEVGGCLCHLKNSSVQN